MQNNLPSNKHPQQSGNLWQNLPKILKECAAIIRAIKWNGNIVSITGTLVVSIPLTILITERKEPIPPPIDYVIKPKFEMAGAFSEGLARVRINGKTGYINPNGDIVIQPKFDGAQSFSEGLALAWNYGKNRGYIDKDGIFLIQPEYGRNAANQFSQGLARVCHVSTCGYIDKTGKFVIERNFTGAGNFSENLAPIKIGSKWGYINPKGDTVIQPKFDNVSSFSEGLAPIKIDGKWGYINTKGDTVIQPKFDDAKFDPYSRYKCDVAEPPQTLNSGNPKGIICQNLEDRYDFSEGLASVMIKDKWGYINKDGKVVISPQFTRVSKFSERLAAACNEDKCGYIPNPLKQ
ncbi:WG repeat-containing protein [Nostoc sp. UHCC 0251]|uniref:WG repeat-containing protein n=1 Tax=Nostoc sp. UHCC 0251 TaxID=3110240 RepID=UPI002B1F5329|nr:WG repeat-containing protein [Nostoc sp. UHCC 0251]MEA5627713.1 WG repeat-containing protein [Nostoc sp. UHCC 0251]